MAIDLPFSDRVKPIIGNPNLELDIQLQQERGKIASPKQRRLEGISAIANGISTAVDNFYDIRKSQASIDYTEAATKSVETRNEIAQLQLQRDAATQEAQINTKKLKLAKEAATASLASTMTQDAKEAYRLSTSPDERDRVEFLTGPKWAKFRADNGAFTEDVLSTTYAKAASPATRQVLDEEVYKPRAMQYRQEQAKGALADIKSQRKNLESIANKSDASAYIDKEELKNATPIVGADQFPDLVLPDGSLASSKIPVGKDQKALREDASRIARLYGDLRAKEEDIYMAVRGEDASGLQARREAQKKWSEQYSSALKDSNSSDVATKMAGRKKVDELLAIKENPLAAAPQGETPEVPSEPQTSNLISSDILVSRDISIEEYDQLVQTFNQATVNTWLNNPEVKKKYLEAVGPGRQISYANFVAAAIAQAKLRKQQKK